MKLNPYLNFDGQCRQAFAFYQRVLGGELVTMTYGESPVCDQMPAGTDDRVMHTCLVSGDVTLMGSDAPPENFEKAQGTYLTLSLNDLEDARGVFNALADNGTVQMPFEETFFALGFGMLADQFGTPWMVICEKPCGPPA